ncbi:vacuolar transporter chaperone [Mortierella sp. NVP41]|nr:vacuolar transporter chaperone [Mortierella sp. NVP41]
MDPNDQQFTAIELHNQMNNNNNTAQSRNTFGNTTDTTTNDLASLSPTTTPPNKTRPASVYSQSGGVRTTRKTKQGFWATIKPRKFTFRPEGITRPKKANSFGNKKAKFSNERTMVHWIKSAMLMGSLAMTLLSFGENNLTPYIGVALLVICLMTLIYSNTVFQVRMEWLNMRRDDVQYYDRVAPTILAFLVMITFGFNGVVMYTGEYHTNKMFLKPFGM